MNFGINFRRLNIVEKILLWTYVFSFAFDFKGQEGGTISQFVMAAVSLVAGIGFIFCGYRKNKVINLYHSLKRVTILWWFYIFSTVITALIAGVMIERYIRLIFPLLLFGISLLIICKFQKRLIDPQELIKICLFASITAVLWKAFYAIQISNISMEVMRYQILSGGGSIYIIAYAFTEIIIKQRFKPLSIISLGTVLLANLLSVTRSLIISVFLQFCGIAWIISKSSLKKNIKRTLIIAPFIFIVVSISLVISNELRPGIIQEWTNRIFYHSTENYFSTDLTLLTRLAEWSGQWQALTENMTSLLFGRGLGSEYIWDSQYYDQLINFMNRTDLIGKGGWYYGHSMWIYFLYSGGLMFGWVIIAVSFLSLFRIIFVVRKKYFNTISFQRDIPPVLFLFTLGFIGQGFTSCPIAFRFFALLAGLIFGMIHWFYDYVKLEEA